MKAGFQLQRKGFTLIEILVVLAIIGILSSIFLSRVNEARAKAVDANIKTNLSILTEAGEVFNDTNTTYAGFCTATSTVRSLEAAAQLSTGSTGGYHCNDSATAWAAAVPLQSLDLISATSGKDFWCVETRTSPRFSDSTTTLAAGGLVCD